jgi:hypothetical protein
MFLQAVGLLHDRFYDPSSQRIINALSGYVFLGCPHAVYNRPQEWDRLVYLLKLASKGSYKKAKDSDEIASVSNVSLKFEEAGFETPVLSIFEMEESKLKEDLFKTWKGVVSNNSESLKGRLLTRVSWWIAISRNAQ